MRCIGFKQRTVTLIQVLIAIAMMAMVSGVVGLNVVRALAQERYYGSVNRLTQKLRLAQGVMLSCGVDTRVVFVRENETVYCLVEALDTVSPSLLNLMGGKEELRGIDRLYFTEQGERTFRGDGLVEISFLASGEETTVGLFEITGSGAELKRFIWLPGYPSQIQAFPEAPPKKLRLMNSGESEALYPNAV